MIVSNATPLIYLAKVKRLDLLQSVFGTVIIPAAVKNEVVDLGKQNKQPDALLIDKGIAKGWIQVKKHSPVSIKLDLDEGEKSVISLAHNLKISDVLIDEISARTAAKLLDLKPKGTIYVLLKALEMKTIDFDEFLSVMKDLLEQGFRLKEEIF